MPAYRYSVDQRVVDVFVEADEETRSRLRSAFEQLAAHPDQPPDFVSGAPNGREIAGRFFGNWLVRYWVDAPVKIVAIVDCQET